MCSGRGRCVGLNMRKFVCAVAFLAASIAAADAATLSGVQGQVLVNKGNGFVQADPGTEILPGDRVLVQPGGSAQITYPNGAVGNVPSGGVFTVPTTPPAAPPLNTAGGPPSGGIPNGLLIAGGAAVAIGAGVLIYNATKSSSP